MSDAKRSGYERERRKQKRLECLVFPNPVCIECGENDERCLELHHIAGRFYDDTVCIVCRNCHRKLSDAQCDHPTSSTKPPEEQERIGRFLLGLADLFLLLAERLQEFGGFLIESYRTDDLPDRD